MRGLVGGSCVLSSRGQEVSGGSSGGSSPAETEVVVVHGSLVLSQSCGGWPVTFLMSSPWWADLTRTLHTNTPHNLGSSLN